MTTKLWRFDTYAARNEDFIRSFRLTAGGSAIDLTGAALAMQVRDKADNVLLDASTANGKITITDATGGYWKVKISHTLISALSVGVYTHDVVLTYANGDVRRVLVGSFNVVQGVTR